MTTPTGYTPAFGTVRDELAQTTTAAAAEAKAAAQTADIHAQNAAASDTSAAAHASAAAAAQVSATNHASDAEAAALQAQTTLANKANLADLASTSTGKGAALIATSGGDTLQDVADGKAIRASYFRTRTAAAAAGAAGTIPAWASALDIGGSLSEGDCPRHRYMWMASVNAGWSALAYFSDTSARGGYWVYAGEDLDPRFFGAIPDRFAYENAVISTAAPNQFTVAKGQFTSADIGKVVGLETGGAATPAIYRLDFRMVPYAGRTLTINGTVITFVTSGAAGMQVNVGSSGSISLYQVAKNLADLVNANSATFGCTAFLPDQSTAQAISVDFEPSLELIANTPGTSGNSIAVNSTCEFWMVFRYADTFFNGKASGPLTTTITSVSGAFGGSQTIGIAAPVQVSATAVNVAGGTDNSAAIAAALSVSGADTGFMREAGSGPGGIGEFGRKPVVLRQDAAPVTQTNVYAGGSHNRGYGVLSPVLLLSFTTLRIDNTTALAALPGFPARRAVIETGAKWAGSGAPDGKVPTVSARVEGPGNIIATDWADRGIWLRSAQYNFVGNGLRITGAAHKGMEWGDPAARYLSWSNELGSVLIQNKCSKTNTNGTNRPDSVGFHCSTATDSLWPGKCDVVGYRYGAMLDRTGTFAQSHCWTWAGGGPLKASYVVRADGVTLLGAESDTPCSLGDTSVGECYAFWGINASFTVYAPWNHSAGDGTSSGGAVNDELTYCRNEGGPFSATQQPVITFFNARTTGMRCKRPAIGPGTFKAGVGGVIEALTRFVGGLTPTTNVNQLGFAYIGPEPLGSHNVVDNPTFNVWRSATAQSILSSGASPIIGPERWKVACDATTGSRVIRQVQSPAISGRNAYQYALEIEQTSTINGSYCRLFTRLPRKALLGLSNKPVTLFYGASTVSGDPGQLTASAIQNFGTGSANAAVTTSLGNLNPNSGNGWVINTILPTISATDIKDDAYLELRIDIPVTSTGAWKLDISAIGLFFGALTTYEAIIQPIEHGEAQAAQRYYETGSVYGPSTTPFWVPFKAQKRATPTVTVSSGSASQVTVDGFLWTPAGVGAATFTADASL